MPAGRQWTGFGFAITHDAGDEQVRIVKHRSKGVAQGISQLTALMNGARCLRSYVTGDAPGKGELFEEPAHAFFVLRDIREALAVTALQIGVTDQSRASMPRTRDVNH